MTRSGLPESRGATIERERERIRSARGAPERGRPTTRDRQRVFSATLKQFDDLIDSSSRVGTETAPILMYYALTQAARAASAARLPAPWRLRGHGLSFSSGSDPLDVANWTAKPTSPKPESLFGGIRRIAQEPQPMQSFTLGRLWASLEELSEIALDESPSPIMFRCYRLPDSDEGYGQVFWNVERRLQTSAIAQELRHYSGFDQVAATLKSSTPGEGPRFANMHQLTWDWTDPEPPSYRRPDLPHLPDEPTTWWMIAFILGSAARYEPEAWQHHVDLDSSEYASRLRTGVGVLLGKIIQLTSDLVSGRRVRATVPAWP